MLWCKRNGKGSKLGGTLTLYKNKIIKIAIEQMANENYLWCHTFCILYKSGNFNLYYKENAILDIPLIIACGGNGACSAKQRQFESLFK